MPFLKRKPKGLSKAGAKVNYILARIKYFTSRIDFFRNWFLNKKAYT